MYPLGNLTNNPYWSKAKLQISFLVLFLENYFGHLSSGVGVTLVLHIRGMYLHYVEKDLVSTQK